MPSAPPRLHVLLAKDAPVGLVIRRGPIQVLYTALWNRETDEFTSGPWMRGRMYERRCDLSADGRQLIYSAMNGRWDSEARGAWTSLPRVPNLKAVTLLAKEDCWNGGGRFTRPRTYWLNDSDIVSPEGQGDSTTVSSSAFGSESLGVYYQCLQRDGWKLLTHDQRDDHSTVTSFEKPLRDGWILEKVSHEEPGSPSDSHWDEHRLVHPETGRSIDAKQWGWADLDGVRLVWASAGKLLSGDLQDDAIANQRVLHDFNDMTFEAVVLPH